MTGEEVPDDDFVFIPSAWDVAVELRIRAVPETDREPLAELIDALLVSFEGRQIDRIATEAVTALWSDDLQRMIREGLEELANRDGWEDTVTCALAELDRHPTNAEVSREVICHMAMHLGHDDLPHPLFCLHCLEEEIAAAPPEHRARIALRTAAICASATNETPGSREEARRRLGRIGGYARGVLPALSVELCAIGAVPTPTLARDDDVWCAIRSTLLAEAAPFN